MQMQVPRQIMPLLIKLGVVWSLEFEKCSIAEIIELRIAWMQQPERKADGEARCRIESCLRSAFTASMLGRFRVTASRPRTY